MRGIAYLLSLYLLTVLSACSTTKPWTNEPMQPGEVMLYDNSRQFFDPSRANDMIVVASFSGGGSRAAALAHATLAELDEIKFKWNGRETSLTREIDVVTGVSGGSIAAAHLALHGHTRHLGRFPADFLQIDFQGRVLRAAVSPGNLFRMTSPWFGRGHVLADELDRLIVSRNNLRRPA